MMQDDILSADLMPILDEMETLDYCPNYLNN